MKSSYRVLTGVNVNNITKYSVISFGIFKLLDFMKLKTGIKDIMMKHLMIKYQSSHGSSLKHSSLKSSFIKQAFLSIFLLATLFTVGTVSAAQNDRITFKVMLTDQGFQPAQLIVPAGKRIRIEMTNKTAKVAELESFDMKFEKIVSPGVTVSVFTGPLRAGNYSFFDDYSVNGVKGTLVAKDQ